jgi:cyclophilin family peptidyl-prolyl cis-trans isomerase
MLKKTIAAIVLVGVTFFMAIDSAVTAEKNPTVIMKTSMGDIEIELDKGKAEKTVENFLAYTKESFYNGTIFHRVIDGFMIQGGGMTKDLKPKTTKKPIKNEADNGLSNKRGTIAMARTNVVDSATSQFFINVVDNGNLDHKSKKPGEYGYAVFGKVTKGMDVVDKIKGVKTGTKNGFRDVPVETVEIKSVTLKK